MLATIALYCTFTISCSGLLYQCDGRICLSVVDVNTMMPRYYNHCLYCYPIDIVAKCDQFRIASTMGVHVYSSDGTCSGQCYLYGELCWSIACTSNGYSVVGMEDQVAVVSSDLTSLYYISTSPQYVLLSCQV